MVVNCVIVVSRKGRKGAEFSPTAKAVGFPSVIKDEQIKSMA